jgi:hypothetical protein
LRAAEKAAVSYVGVSLSSGIHFQHNNSATPEKYLIEMMAGGVAVFDYDDDGWPDEFLVNGARIRIGQQDSELLDKSEPEFWNRLYRNNHDGTFTDMTEKAGVRGTGYGMGAAVGDFDNDGFDGLAGHKLRRRDFISQQLSASVMIFAQTNDA